MHQIQLVTARILYCVKLAAKVDSVLVAPAKICVPSVASIICAMQKGNCQNVQMLLVGFLFSEITRLE